MPEKSKSVSGCPENSGEIRIFGRNVQVFDQKTTLDLTKMFFFQGTVFLSPTKLVVPIWVRKWCMLDVDAEYAMSVSQLGYYLVSIQSTCRKLWLFPGMAIQAGSCVKILQSLLWRMPICLITLKCDSQQCRDYQVTARCQYIWQTLRESPSISNE